MPCTTIVFLSYFNDYIEINYSTIKDITSLRLCCTGGDFRVSNRSCGFWDLPVDCVWLWAVWEDDIWCSTKSRPGVEPRIVIAYKRGSIDGCVTSPHPSPGLRTSRCNSSEWPRRQKMCQLLWSSQVFSLDVHIWHIFCLRGIFLC